MEIALSLAANPHLDIRMDMKTPGLTNLVEHATLTYDYPPRGRLMVMKNCSTTLSKEIKPLYPC